MRRRLLGALLLVALSGGTTCGGCVGLDVLLNSVVGSFLYGGWQVPFELSLINNLLWGNGQQQSNHK